MFKGFAYKIGDCLTSIHTGHAYEIITEFVHYDKIVYSLQSRSKDKQTLLPYISYGELCTNFKHSPAARVLYMNKVSEASNEKNDKSIPYYGKRD